MSNLEPSLDGFIVLRIFIDLSQAVVARDDDPLWPDEQGASFGFAGERVVVCPDLHLVCSDQLRTEVFDDHSLLPGVVAPPHIGVLDIRIWVALSCLPGLARSSVPVVILME